GFELARLGDGGHGGSLSGHGRRRICVRRRGFQAVARGTRRAPAPDAAPAGGRAPGTTAAFAPRRPAGTVPAASAARPLRRLTAHRRRGMLWPRTMRRGAVGWGRTGR